MASLSVSAADAASGIDAHSRAPTMKALNFPTFISFLSLFRLFEAFTWIASREPIGRKRADLIATALVNATDRSIHECCAESSVI